MSTPTDIANQALDAAGIEFTLGDIEEGTRPAQVILRAYGQCLRQLLRAAHWNFARKTAPLTLLADATGQTQNVGNLVPVPWIYSFAYPTDCVKARYVPWNMSQNTAPPTGNIQIGQQPIMTGLAVQPQAGQRVRPARFCEAMDYNYLPAPPIDLNTQGVSPQGRTVVLTNVANAQMIYTCLMLYPSNWDPMFRAGFVAYLASEIALPLSKDKKLGMALRSQQIAITKDKVMQARITDGNEGWFTTTHVPDWIRARRTGVGGYGFSPWGDGGSEAGVLGYGWDAISFGDGGSAF